MLLLVPKYKHFVHKCTSLLARQPINCSSMLSFDTFRWSCVSLQSFGLKFESLVNYSKVAMGRGLLHLMASLWVSIMLSIVYWQFVNILAEIWKGTFYPEFEGWRCSIRLCTQWFLLSPHWHLSIHGLLPFHWRVLVSPPVCPGHNCDWRNSCFVKAIKYEHSGYVINRLCCDMNPDRQQQSIKMRLKRLHRGPTN